MHGLTSVGAIVLCLGATASLSCYWLGKRHIAKFARRVTQDCQSQRHAAFALARVIFSEVWRTDPDPVFISPLLSVLGASPVAVLQRGGCCSGTHRLFITALDAIGIRAAQVTVFRQSDPGAAHCLAQVTAGTENLLIDVDYGVWYTDSRGGAIDLLALRSGVQPVIEPFGVGTARYANSPCTRPAGYPDDEYYRFDYALTRTANWYKATWRRVLYIVLHRLTQGRVDSMLLPPELEWPEMLLSLTFCLAALMLLGASSVATLVR